MIVISEPVRLSCLTGLILLLASASVHHPITVQITPANSPSSTIHSIAEQTAIAVDSASSSASAIRLVELALGSPNQSGCELPCEPSELEINLANETSISMKTIEQLSNDVKQWDYDVYLQHSGSVTTLSGVQAYMAYLYLSMCQDSIRNSGVFSAESERLELLRESTADLTTQYWVDERLVTLENEFVRCHGLDQSVLVARIEWLTRSAELGYAPAQAQYYQTIPELTSQDHLISFRFPHLIDRFRQLAPRFLSATLSEDSPESYLLYSRAILDGVVLDPNAIDAYAYAYAALLLDDHRSSDLELELDAIASILAPTELKSARQQGQALAAQASVTS